MTENNHVVNDTAEETQAEESSKKPRGRPRKPPPPPKEPKQGPQSLYLTDRKAYHRKYYAEKVRRLTCCQICNKTFNTEYLLRRHLLNNKTCMLIKLTAKLEELQKEEKPTPQETASWWATGCRFRVGCASPGFSDETQNTPWRRISRNTSRIGICSWIIISLAFRCFLPESVRRFRRWSFSCLC